MTQRNIQVDFDVAHDSHMGDCKGILVFDSETNTVSWNVDGKLRQQWTWLELKAIVKAAVFIME